MITATLPFAIIRRMQQPSMGVRPIGAEIGYWTVLARIVLHRAQLYQTARRKIERETSAMADEQLRVDVGDAAPDVSVQDETGGEVQLARYWSERPVAFVFVRHFG